MDDLLLQCYARGNGLDRSFDFRRQERKLADRSLRIAAAMPTKAKPGTIEVTRFVDFDG
jgi:hypothetical protein